MGLAFKLHLPADKKFLLVGEIPALTANAIYPESEDGNGYAWVDCQIGHKEALDKAIKAGMVTPLHPSRYVQHTFPFGDALRRAVISLDDFKRFAESLHIEVVVWDEPDPTQSDEASNHTKRSINRNIVMASFSVKTDHDENQKFWDGRLSRPSKTLKDARIFSGKRGVSALWDPLLIAHYLLAGKNGKSHMTRRQLDVVMNKHFPELFDLWKEQTLDAR